MNFLYLIIISPIETIVDWVFNFILNKFGSFGVIGAVFGVSLAINFLALPLYNVADSLQEKERRIAKSLEHRVGRIKKAFRGDERFMMLSTYYRLNNYHPLYVLRSSLSILIEIPFFIAAYHYLSHNEFLRGASWWIFSDLGSSDNFFSVGNFQIHVLPILMTLINFVSGAIYLKDAPFREKLQLYGIAFVFLFLLYNSPSGLVIYWILNNIFSLVKNIVMRMKNPGKIFYRIISFIFICMTLYFILFGRSFVKKSAFLVFSVFFTLFPFFKEKYFGKFFSKKIFTAFELKPDFFVLLFSGIGLSLFCGLLLPSSLIATSSADFSFLGNTDSPLSYIWSSIFVFSGFFIFWPVAIYKMFGTRVKFFETGFLFVIFICAVLNAFVFKYDYGFLNLTFTLEHRNVLEVFTPFYSFLPLILLVLTVFFFAFIVKKGKTRFLVLLLFILSAAELSFGIVKCSKIHSEFLQFTSVKEESVYTIKKDIHLSKTDKNVLILFFDRAINSYFPYFLEQFPQYEKSFNGFTYYKNALSYGAHTVSGSPAMLGGYEYTPDELNARDSELLMEKHNEASLVMPKLFLDGGYNVSVFDPPCPNYTDSNFPDYSAFNKYPEITVKKLRKIYSQKFYKLYEKNSKFEIDSVCRKEIRNFVFLEILNPLVRLTFYDSMREPFSDITEFIDTYSSLFFIDEETDFDSEKGNFIFIGNDSVHSPAFLDESFTFPLVKSNDNFHVYETFDEFESKLYESFCAAFIKLAQYFDFIRENGAWNNTRIIIVADHGYKTSMSCFGNFTKESIPEAKYDFTDDYEIPASFDALLMVKDFNANEKLKTDNSFMTNGDTVFLATEGLGLSDLNPFTGKKFEPNKENGINVNFQVDDEISSTELRNKTKLRFEKKYSWHVNSGDKREPKNWIPLLEWEKSH